jgi:hypothetical protein
VFASTICAQFCKTLSEMIRDRVKDMPNVSRRYKYVCVVTIGQKTADCRNSIIYASRCIWAPATDNFATVNFENTNLFAVATLWATYME